MDSITGIGALYESLDIPILKIGRPTAQSLNVPMDGHQMLAGFYGIEKDNQVAALGLILHDKACQLAEYEASLKSNSIDDKDGKNGEVEKKIDIKVIIIACGVLIAIIVIALVFILLLKARRQKRRAKVSNKIVVFNTHEVAMADTEAGLKESPVVSSLPNRDIKKDNVQLDTQDDINVMGIGSGRTTNRSDLGSALEERPKEQAVESKVEEI